MKYILFMMFTVIFFVTHARHVKALENVADAQLSDLENYQVNTPQMVSSGLPNSEQFEKLKAIGVSKVIDLIPGDRTEESRLMKALDLSYHNIPVEWENPTIENFDDYASTMNRYNSSEGITLTHCRLNWRGAVFTYLYRVTQLNEPEELAKQDLLLIWEPNEIWQDFIDQVKAKYSAR